MSLQRIILTPEQVRNHLLTVPPIGSGAIVMVEARTRHLTNSQILSLAMDLLGPMLTIHLVKELPEVLVPWGSILEDYGWGPSVRPIDLQMSLLVNAIKAIATRGVSNPLEAEGRVFALIKKIAESNHELENALVSSLVINKGFTLPWALVIPMPVDPTDTSFGIWVDQN